MQWSSSHQPAHHSFFFSPASQFASFAISTIALVISSCIMPLSKDDEKIHKIRISKAAAQAEEEAALESSRHFALAR
jgi:hypothetical protein